MMVKINFSCIITAKKKKIIRPEANLLRIYIYTYMAELSLKLFYMTDINLSHTYRNRSYTEDLSDHLLFHRDKKLIV